jgi:hypothetical protein
MTLLYTSRFKLAYPDFLSEPWHSEFAAAMESIDQTLYNALIAQTTALWLNSTAYLVGNIVISPDTGAMFTCAVAHTSTASPQTFTQEQVAHPTFWVVLAPTLASQVEAEAGVENTKYMSPLRTKQSISALASQTSPYVPHCGILAINTSTLLKFVPWNGDKIKINGVLYDIPAAGIAGLGNTNIRVNGVAGQNLAADTIYFVTAFTNAGVVTANYKEVAGSVINSPSLTAGNEGVEVLWDGTTEFPNYTIIGIICTDPSGEFVDLPWQRFVRSWFNRAATGMQTWLTASATTTSNTYVEISTALRLEWVGFEGELVRLDFDCPLFSASATGINVSIGLDSASPQNTWGLVASAAGAINARSVAVSTLLNASVGYHFATPLYCTTGGILATAYVFGNTNGFRPTFRGTIHPSEFNLAV